MTLVTIFQANNPETLPVMITEPELVLESELPARLANLNLKTTAITYDENESITQIPEIRTDELRVKNGNMNDVLSITSGISPHEPIMNFYNDRTATCYGALVATNVNWSNKTDIENLQTKTQNINANGTVLSNIFTINGNKIGAPASFKYNDEAPFIPVVGTDGVVEIGRYIDFHAADVNYDFWTRIMCVGQHVLEILGTSSMRMSRLDVSLGMSLRHGNTLMRFTGENTSVNMLTLDSNTNIATFLGNVVAPNITTLETKTQNITGSSNLTTFTGGVGVNTSSLPANCV